MAAPRRARGGSAPQTAEQHGRPIAAMLAIGLTLLAVALVVTLSHAEPRRTGTNETAVTEALAVTESAGTFCQPRELIPAETGAVRLSLKATTHRPSSVEVAVMRGGATIARGARTLAWTGQRVVVPLRTVLDADVAGRVCVTVGGQAPVALGGETTDAAVAARTGSQPLAGRLRIDYLRRGRESWWSFASSVAHRMGIGRALGGTSIALLTAVLTLTSIALASWQLARRAA